MDVVQGVHEEIVAQKLLDNVPVELLDVPERVENPEYAQELKAIASSKLAPALINAEKTRCRNWPIYQSAVLTLRHLNQLRLLNSIENKVRDMNQEANRFLLSDTHTLLHSLIKDSDSPFIFEKIGTRLNNIMIDEFQDTSTVQWQNFKVLLEECMSHSSEQGNLIVGDVKQSIYRWRSGDWRMLNNIEREFPTMRNMLNVKSLDTNYRSSRRVINFNNAFFTQAAEIEYKELTTGDELQDENTDNGIEAVCAELSKYPVSTRVNLKGTIIVARDIAHAKLKANRKSRKRFKFSGLFAYM